jgi:hypothetical protein
MSHSKACRLQMYWSSIGTMTWMVSSASPPPIASRNPRNSCRSPRPRRSPTRIIPMPRTLITGVRTSMTAMITCLIALAICCPIPVPSRARAVGAVVVSAIVDSRTTNHTIVFIFLAFVRHRRAAAVACPLPRRQLPEPIPEPFPGILRGHRVLSPPPHLRG